jgi:hypothetical protein
MVSFCAGFAEILRNFCIYHCGALSLSLSFSLSLSLSLSLSFGRRRRRRKVGRVRFYTLSKCYFFFVFFHFLSYSDFVNVHPNFHQVPFFFFFFFFRFHQNCHVTLFIIFPFHCAYLTPNRTWSLNYSVLVSSCAATRIYSETSVINGSEHVGAFDSFCRRPRRQWSVASDSPGEREREREREKERKSEIERARKREREKEGRKERKPTLLYYSPHQ